MESIKGSANRLVRAKTDLIKNTKAKEFGEKIGKYFVILQAHMLETGPNHMKIKTIMHPFAFNMENFTTRRIFCRAPSVLPVANMRFACCIG